MGGGGGGRVVEIPPTLPVVGREEIRAVTRGQGTGQVLSFELCGKQHPNLPGREPGDFCHLLKDHEGEHEYRNEPDS